MKVAVQQGHCHRTRGATGTAGEQVYVQAVAKDLKARLERLGHTCVLLLADESVPRTDVFVALHADGSLNPSARGASYGHRNAASKQLGELFLSTYQRMGYAGGVRPPNYTQALASYYGTGRAHVAGTPLAIVIEGGFLTNLTDRAWMTSQPGIAACAQALVAAVTRRAADPPAQAQEDDMPPGRLIQATDGPQKDYVYWERADGTRIYWQSFDNAPAFKKRGYIGSDQVVKVSGVYLKQIPEIQAS